MAVRQLSLAVMATQFSQRFPYSFGLQLFGDDVAGSVAHFGKYFGKVFTNQRQAEQLHGAQQQDYDNQ